MVLIYQTPLLAKPSHNSQAEHRERPYLKTCICLAESWKGMCACLVCKYNLQPSAQKLQEECLCSFYLFINFPICFRDAKCGWIF